MRIAPCLAGLALVAAGCGGASDKPSTMPGPERIAFVSNRGDNVDVYVTHADGTSVRRLTEHPRRDEAPAWSLDGTQIAFVSDRDRNGRLCLATAASSAASCTWQTPMAPAPSA